MKPRKEPHPPNLPPRPSPPKEEKPYKWVKKEPTDNDGEGGKQAETPKPTPKNPKPKPKAAAVHAPYAPEGCFEGQLMDEVPIVINGDYGADCSIISEDHLAACARKNLFVPQRPLDQPVTVDLAMSSKDASPNSFTASKAARISVTLHTSAGPLRLRNVEFLVFDSHLPQVLLSRSVLKSMHFDLDKHLATVRCKFHDTDFSHIGILSGADEDSAPTKPSSLARHLINRVVNPNNAPGDDGTRAKTERYSPSPTFYGDSPDDDPLRSDGEVEAGVETPKPTEIHLQEGLKLACEAGLPPELEESLRTVVHLNQDVFRTKLGNDPPAKVPPMNIRLQPNATPIRVPVRRYSPPQAQFLRNKVEELLDLGLIRPNTESAWACAPLIIPKSGPEQFRFTVDLRPVNNQTVPFTWPMPHLETVLQELQGATCYATIDLCHGYWQMPLAEASQECQSFITPDGVYTPNRVLHGQTNATFYFQGIVANICKPIRSNILQWLDDVLLHAKTPEELIQVLSRFLELCQQHNIKLHAKKCRFYVKEVKWCGRIISQYGVKMDPRSLSTLLEMPPPTTADQLQQFLCAANWMRSTIPEHNKLVHPLQELLEQASQHSQRRTKKALAKIALQAIGWSNTHSVHFQNVKDDLINAITLAHPVDSKRCASLLTPATNIGLEFLPKHLPKIATWSLSTSATNH